jgi:NitT/TauT family transport system substrate-binding protein
MRGQVSGLLAVLVLAGCGSGAGPAAPSLPSSTTAKPAISTPASAAPPTAAIKLGFSQAGVGYGPFFAAKDAGFFSSNGLDVSLQQVNGPAAVPALLADEIQIDGFGANELTRAVLAGAPLVAIATLGDLPVWLLYADKKYKSVQDLAGQTIGVTAIGSSTDVTARLFLDHYGMLDKVKIAAVGGTIATELAALSQGVAAAVIVSPDAGAQAASAGFVPIVDGVKLGVPLNFSVIAVKTSYLKDHRDTIRSFLRAYQQSWSYLGDRTNKGTAVDLLAQNTRAPKEAVEVGYDAWQQVWSGVKTPTINPEGINNTLKFADDPKAKAAKGEQFIDNSILESIQ